MLIPYFEVSPVFINIYVVVKSNNPAASPFRGEFKVKRSRVALGRPASEQDGLHFFNDWYNFINTINKCQYSSSL
jgi:hypothetical protein